MTRTHCPHCGAPVPRGATACPSCGSDERTGWAPEEVRNDALWGGFDDEDYREVIRSLPGARRRKPRPLRARLLLLVALLAAAAFLVATLAP